MFYLKVERHSRRREIKAIVFDKTGTVTEGRPIMMDFVFIENANINNIDERGVFRMVAIAESASEHPISGAVVSAAVKRELRFLSPRNSQLFGEAFRLKLTDTRFGWE